MNYKVQAPSIRQLFSAAVLVAVGMLLTFPASAQTTFTVTVGPKTSAHPWFNQGWPEGYLIDATEGNELTLTRGETYIFQMQNVDAMHPFYISTSSSGGSAGQYTNGVQGNFATGNAALTFAVPADAPDDLFYQCSFHPLMGGVINVVSATSDESLADLPNRIVLDQNYPNPFNPSTSIRFSLPAGGLVTLSVFDALGREIAVLANGLLPSGSHEVSWDGRADSGEPVASGVYIYRITTDREIQARAMTLLR